MSHIFISYSRTDTEIMQRIRTAFIESHFDVWTDETGLEPGTIAWQQGIANNIESASCIVVLLSPNSKNSEWVQRELLYAENFGVRIFPVLIDGNEKNAIPISLITIQRVDLRKDILGNIQNLISVLNKHLSMERMPLRYLEIGKITTSTFASDFCALSYSSGMNRYQNQIFRLTNEFQSRDVSNLHGTTVAAFTKFMDGYIFIQCQFRNEADFILRDDDVRAMRPYFQSRYVFLLENEIISAFSKGYVFYPSLLSGTPKNNFRLQPYTKVAGEKHQEVLLRTPTSNFPNDEYPCSLWNFQDLEPLDSGKIINVAETICEAGRALVYVGDRWSLQEKILLVQAVQRLVLPIKGILTFSFDNLVEDPETINLHIVSSRQDQITDRNTKQLNLSTRDGEYRKKTGRISKLINALDFSSTSWNETHRKLYARDENGKFLILRSLG